MITEVDGSGKNAVDFKEFMDMMSKGGTRCVVSPVLRWAWAWAGS
jgi:Ca2+-binding EF-hand superfamily protein